MKASEAREDPVKGRALHIVSKSIIIFLCLAIIGLLNYLAYETQASPLFKNWILRNYGSFALLLDQRIVLPISVLNAGIIIWLLRPKPKPKGTLRRLASYVWSHWPYVIAIAIAMVSADALDLAQPWIIGFLLVGQVIALKQPGLIPLVLVLLASAFAFKQIMSFIEDYLTQSLGAKTVHKLRCDIYRRVEHLPLTFLDHSRSGELMSRVIDDTEEVDSVITGDLPSLASDFIIVVGAASLIFYADRNVALVTVPAMIGLVIVVNSFKRRVKRGSRRIREAAAELSARAYEVISGIRIVKSFTRERAEAREFRDRSAAIAKSKIRLSKLSSLYGSSVDLITTLAVIGLLLLTVPRVLAGSLALGALIAMLGLLDKMFGPLVSLSKANFKLQQAAAAGDRIFEIMDTKGEVLDATYAFSPPYIQGRVEFEKVSFQYEPDRKVLDNFSMAIQPGETVAIVGASGVGKSTIVNLILRFYEPNSGFIRIDGYPIGLLKLGFLRESIGLVIQDPILFTGSVRENIAYGKLDASEEEIIQAARLANADEFIMTLSDGYKTEIGERGVTLSVGQRQRIAIARALIKNPKILVLDEATSNVDSESEALIQQSMRRMHGERTTIVIAHRLSTVMEANRIIVMEDGGIVEVGTHDALLQNHGTYTRLYQSQLKPLVAQASIYGNTGGETN